MITKESPTRQPENGRAQVDPPVVPKDLSVAPGKSCLSTTAQSASAANLKVTKAYLSESDGFSPTFVGAPDAQDEPWSALLIHSLMAL